MASLTRLPRKHLTSLTPSRLSRPLTTTCIRQTRQQPTPTPITTNPTSRSLHQKRSYHSSLHSPLPLHTYNNSQISILEASLAHIPTHGFTSTALTLGARDAGFLDVSVQLFPRAEFDLILFWLASRRGLLRAKAPEVLAAAATEKAVESLDVDTKIKVLIMERLRLNEPIRDQWQDVLTLPFPSLPSFSNLLTFYIGPRPNVLTGKYPPLPNRTPHPLKRHPQSGWR